MSTTTYAAQNLTTFGIYSEDSSLLTGGLQSIENNTPKTIISAPPPTLNSTVNLGLRDSTADLVSQLTPAQLAYTDPNGNPVYSQAGLTPSPSVVGSSDLIHNPSLGYGVNSIRNTVPLSETTQHSKGVTTYTGTDLRIIIEVADAMLPTPSGVHYSKQIVECTTISISVHRVKSPSRALGYVNPKGFARGGRTIAGTLVLTQFTVDVLYKFLQASLWNDTSKDTIYSKVDQIPPLNFTMVFEDELGNASCRRLLGVDIIDDGTIYSVNDALTEQTFVYQATDFTPLLPFDENASTTGPQRQSQTSERTPTSVMLARQQVNNPHWGTGNVNILSTST